MTTEQQPTLWRRILDKAQLVLAFALIPGAISTAVLPSPWYANALAYVVGTMFLTVLIDKVLLGKE